MVSTLDMVMLDSGYRKEALTFFICEGVTHYLSAPAVDAMFRYVARAAAGSQMVFTYIHRGILDGSVTFSGADTTLTTVRRAGEQPYTFGSDPVELPAYSTARKLSLVEDVGARTYRERYLIPRGRGQETLTEFQRAALVEVAGHSPWQRSPLSWPSSP